MNVGSIASMGGSVDLDTVMARRSLTRKEFNDSKLALLIFTKELARKIAETGLYDLNCNYNTVKLIKLWQLYLTL